MAKEAKPAPEAQAGDKTIALIAEKHFSAYHKGAMIIASRIATNAGELRELTGEYIEEKNLNSVAYGWIKKLAKIGEMDDQAKAREKIAHILASFDHMRDLLKIDGVQVDEFANLQGRMFSDGTGRPSGEVKAQSDDERDFRPSHLKQPGASAAAEPSGATDAVRALASQAGAGVASDDPLSRVGRGPQAKPN